MGAGALCMTIFALAQFCRRKPSDIAFAVICRAGVGRRSLWLAVHWAGRGAFGSADALGLRGEPGRRRADRICARVHRAHLHLDRRRPARPHFRAADGARHRQFRPARDPVLHPGRLPDGGERHVRSPDRAARTPGRTSARRAQRRDGAVDGDLLRHFRFEDGRRRGCGLGADPGGAPVAPESRAARWRCWRPPRSWPRPFRRAST